MALEERFKELVKAFRDLHREGMDLVRVADLSGTAPGKAAPVEGYEISSLTAAIGRLPELLPAAADAAHKGLIAAGFPVNLDLCRWSLARCQNALDQLAVDFSFDVRSGERVHDLQKETGRLKIGWEQWLTAVIASVARLQPVCLAAQRAVAVCALEIGERACGAAVAIHTTNIGQQIASHHTEDLATEGIT